MAVLEKIRVKFGLAISIIIALALLSFIIDPGTLESALNSMSSKYDVGQIAGKSISYNDFQADIDNYTTINQILSGSTVQNEETQKQIRDAAWQGLLDKFMFVKYAKEAGITVGDDELVDLISGANVSPLIAQNPAFCDENGNFSIDALLQFKENVELDETGQFRTYWNYLQNTVYTQQFYAKYGALFNASNMVNALMLKNDIAENNNTANIDYVVKMFPYAKDSTIVVSSKEIKDYYTSHKENFKQKYTRDAEYVVFEVVPSAQDIAAVGDQMAACYDEFVSTDNMKAFLLKNSDRALSSYWYKAGELKTVSTEVSDFVDAAKVGAVSPVYQNGNSFFAVKVLAEEKLPDNISVRIISAAGAKEISDSLVTALRLAEPMSMTQTYIIPGCEVLFNAPVGKPQIIKTTQYGNLLAEVVEKSELLAKKQVAILEKTALASKETFNKYYAQANTFATLTAGSYEGYKKALDSTKVYSHPVNVNEGTASFGTIDNAKEVTRWIFDNKVGKASNIITVNQNYFFVAVVKGINKEGYAPVEKVSTSIEALLYNRKLAEVEKAKVEAEIAGKSLEDIAAAFNTEIVSKTGVSFTSMGSNAVEPALLGAVASAKEGEINTVAGSYGTYVFKVNGREAGSFYTEDDAKNMNAQKNQYSSQMVMPVMMKNADVKDNRARFF